MKVSANPLKKTKDPNKKWPRNLSRAKISLVLVIVGLLQLRDQVLDSTHELVIFAVKNV